MAAASRVFGNLMVYSVKSNLTDRHVDDDGLAYEGAMSKLAGVSLFRFKPPKSTPQRCAEYRGVVRPYTKFQTGICEPIPRSHFPVVRPHAKTTPMVRFGWTQQLSSTWCQQTGRGVALGTGSGEWHIFVLGTLVALLLEDFALWGCTNGVHPLYRQRASKHQPPPFECNRG
jgi:hypothetical protein